MTFASGFVRLLHNAGFFDAGHRASAWDCEAALAANRTYDLFSAMGGLIVTGPTRTNVNDIRLIAVGVK